MGIRPSLDSNNGDTSANNDYQDLRTFSEDILKIEICGPNVSLRLLSQICPQQQ